MSSREFDVDKKMETVRTYYTRERISVAWFHKYKVFGIVVGKKDVLSVAEEILDHILVKMLKKSYRPSTFTAESISKLYKHILSTFTVRELLDRDVGLRDVILLGATAPTDTLRIIITYGRKLHTDYVVRDLISIYSRLGIVGIILEFKGINHRVYIHEKGAISTTARLDEKDFVHLVLRVLDVFGLSLS